MPEKETASDATAAKPGNNNNSNNITKATPDTITDDTMVGKAKGDTDHAASIHHRIHSRPRRQELWDEELEVRQGVASSLVSGNFVGAFLVNIYSSMHIFVVYLISLESLLSISLSVGMTVYTYNRTKDSGTFDGSIMDWVLLSFAVITPMSASIGMAFSRRDQALQHLATIKTTLWNIYSAHACWDWPKAGNPNTGRRSSQLDWVAHNDHVLHTILRLCEDLGRLLTLPNSGRARHRVTAHGEAEAKRIIVVRNKLHRSIYERVNALTKGCEVIKKQGLPPNEATRIRQWERMVTERVELLVMIKKYRTPQALRSFARLFSVFLPPFYAPFYGQMATDLNSLGMGITFSVFTAVALTSLFESISQMEDPFVGLFVLDGIDVETELGEVLEAQLLDCRSYHYPDAEVFDCTHDVHELPRKKTFRLVEAAET